MVHKTIAEIRIVKEHPYLCMATCEGYVTRCKKSHAEWQGIHRVEVQDEFQAFCRYFKKWLRENKEGAHRCKACLVGTLKLKEMEEK